MVMMMMCGCEVALELKESLCCAFAKEEDCSPCGCLPSIVQTFKVMTTRRLKRFPLLGSADEPTTTTESIRMCFDVRFTNKFADLYDEKGAQEDRRIINLCVVQFSETLRLVEYLLV